MGGVLRGTLAPLTLGVRLVCCENHTKRIPCEENTESSVKAGGKYSNHCTVKL
jgi:hypothetical protein